MIVSAFAALVSNGGAPRASMAMGKGDYDEAEKILGNSVALQIVISAVLTVLLLLFYRPLLLTFGASENTIGFASDYMKIYAAGTVFVQLTLGMNAFITAQGFARTGMLSVMIGAGCNIVLDPVLIYGFGMGVRGAATATVISQAVSTVWVLSFLTGKKTVLKIRKKYLRMEAGVVLPGLALGLAPFIMQASESVITVCFNASLLKYGGDVAVGAMTILSSAMQFSMLPMQGLGQGAQPIISYNYGTGDAARVHETFRLSLKTAFISGLTAFAVMYVFCPYIVAMFLEPGCPAYGIATKGIPYFASGFICFALNIAWIGYYQSIELARKAMLFMLLRGIILMSICFLALPHLLGEKGLWLAVPCAELIIFIALTIDYQYRHKICRVVE